MEPLQLLVLLSASGAGLLLAGHYAGMKRHGARPLFASPAGDPRRGIRYAFTGGMLPWAKESIRENPFSYAAGLAFHAGVFVALALLILDLTGMTLPAPGRLLVRVATFAGALAGGGLLVKRMALPQLRGLSVPDDYVSNLLSSLFVLLAGLGTVHPVLRTLWLVEAALLLAYLPLGKIRHCLFFFTTRRHLGAFFGRRGTFPPGGDSHA